MSTTPKFTGPVCGWLSPSGEYHEVNYGRHDDYMFDALSMNTSLAEELGWIHLSDNGYSHYGTGLCSHLTFEQRRWLVKVGFDLCEGDEE